MAEMRASPVKSQALKRLADIVRLAEERGEMEILPFNPMTLFPVSSTTLENLAYGNLPMAIPSQSNIPITKTGRKQEVAELAGLLPTLPAASRGVAQGANYLGDVLTQAVTRNPQATSMRALDEIARMSPVPQITTYHGSPHLFSKFDPGQKGMGEGAQEFGFGAGYTAEHRPVAEYYKNQLSGLEDLYDGKRFDREDAGHRAARLVQERSGNIEQAIKETKEAIDYDTRNLAIKIESDHPLTDQAKKFLNEKIEMLARLESGQIPTHSTRSLGYLYKGEIPDEIVPLFIDLDKKLSKQSPEVLRAVENVWKDLDINPIWKKDKDGNLYMADFKDLNGREIYSELQHHLSNKGYENADEYASGALEEYGLRGIRYLDATSRGIGKGTSNFIPFSPEDYRIQEINDQPIADFVRSGRLQVAPDDPLAQFLSGR